MVLLIGVSLVTRGGLVDIMQCVQVREVGRKLDNSVYVRQVQYIYRKDSALKAVKLSERLFTISEDAQHIARLGVIEGEYSPC